MSKKERQAYIRGATEMLLNIVGVSIWVVMIVAYMYIKFM